MIFNNVDASPISCVPDADAEVPASRHEQVRNLRIPKETADGAGVSVEYPYSSTVLRVVPHSYGATAEQKTLFAQNWKHLSNSS